MTSGITFCKWSMYFEHTLGVSICQNNLIPSFSSVMFLGLCLFRRKFSIDPHTFSIGFKSGLSAGFFHQMILFAVKKVLNVPTSMFRIVVLVESVVFLICFLHKWDKGGRQNISISCCSQNPLKHHQICSSSLRNPSPNMNFWQGFMFIFKLSGSIFLTEALPLWHSN